MNNLEKLGYIKFDFLGLSTLTKVSICLDLVKKRHGKDIDIYNLNWKDDKVFEQFRLGNLQGIFQFEQSSGFRDLTVQVRPTSLADLSFLVAAYRPGPLGSSGLQDFLAWRAGEKEPEYLIPELEPILNETGNFLVYQEQCMKIATDLCGYTSPESDNLRKIIGKKLPDKMKLEEKKFKSGWMNNGFSSETADTIWSQLVNFASYGFNKTVDKDTKIDTLNGVKKIEDCSKGDVVFTIQPDGKVVLSKVVALHDHGIVPLWEVEFDDGTIEKCTLDHKWLTEWGQQPLWKILDLDCEVWGSAINTQETSDSSKNLQTMQKPSKERDLQCYGEGVPVWYESQDHARRSKETQSQLQRMSSQEKTDPQTNQNEQQQNSSGQKDCVRDSQENLKKTRNMRVSGSSLGPLAIRKSREIPGHNKKSSIKSKKIQNGSVVRTSSIQHWFQTERPDPMSERTQTGGFYQQRPADHPRGGWTMAFSTGSWRRNSEKNSESGQDVGTGSAAPRMETNSDLNGELQDLWGTYKDKLREPLRFTDKWGSPTYSMHRKIIRISYLGMRQGYDLEVDHPSHNYVLASGLCCSNSHSAAYGVTAYITAYLKTYYPVEWMCSAMICDRNNKDQMIKYIAECKRLGINISPPDINKSSELFTIDKKDNIVFGIAPIKNLGEGPVSLIIEEREKNKFKDFIDFCERVNLSKVNRLKVDTLIKAGAFDSIAPNRKSLLVVTEKYWEYRKQLKSFESKLNTYMNRKLKCKQRNNDIKEGKTNDKGILLKPLKNPTYPEQPIFPKIRQFEELPRDELLEYEHELLGFYISEHPLDDYNLYGDGKLMPIEDIKNLADSGEIVLAVVISTTSEITTKKKQQKMAFLTLEDKTGQIDSVAFTKTYSRYKKLFDKKVPLLIYGWLEVTEGEKENICKVRIGKVQELSKIASRVERKENVTLDLRVKIGKIADALSCISSEKNGTIKVRLVGVSENGTEFIFPRLLQISDDVFNQVKELNG